MWSTELCCSTEMVASLFEAPVIGTSIAAGVWLIDASTIVPRSERGGVMASKSVASIWGSQSSGSFSSSWAKRSYHLMSQPSGSKSQLPNRTSSLKIFSPFSSSRDRSHPVPNRSASFATKISGWLCTNALFATMTIPLRARDNITFMRRGSAKNPTASVLTTETMMKSHSFPTRC